MSQAGSERQLVLPTVKDKTVMLAEDRQVVGPDCLCDDEWFYTYPSAADTLYAQLRDDHPDLNPITVTESICNLILNEFIEEAVGDIVGYERGDIHGNDGINKSKFQVLCSKCKKYKAATKYGPHFQKCAGAQGEGVKGFYAEDGDEDGSKSPRKGKIGRRARKGTPVGRHRKKHSLSEDGEHRHHPGHHSHPHGRPTESNFQLFDRKIASHSLFTGSADNPMPDKPSGAECDSHPPTASSSRLSDKDRLSVPSLKPEPDDESRLSNATSVSSLRTLQMKGKKSMFALDDSHEKLKALQCKTDDRDEVEDKPIEAEKKEPAAEDDKEEKNIIVDSLIDWLDKMETDQDFLLDEEEDESGEQEPVDAQPTASTSKPTQEAQDEHGTAAEEPSSKLPPELLIALENLGIDSKLTSELSSEPISDQQFVDQTFDELENEILREFYASDDEHCDEEWSSEPPRKQDFPIEVFDTVSKLFAQFGQRNVPITMGDIVRIFSILSKRYSPFVCRRLYEEMFHCLRQSDVLQKSSVQIEELFQSVPEVVPKTFKDLRTSLKVEQEHEEDTEATALRSNDPNILASLYEQSGSSHDEKDVCVEQLELDCLDDLLAGKAYDIETDSLLELLHDNALGAALPDLSAEQLLEALNDAEQGVYQYLLVNTYLPEVLDSSASTSPGCSSVSTALSSAASDESAAFASAKSALSTSSSSVCSADSPEGIISINL